MTRRVYSVDDVEEGPYGHEFQDGMASQSMGDTEIKIPRGWWLVALCTAIMLLPTPLRADGPLISRPEYDLDIDLWPGASRADVTQLVTWTNPGTAPTSELVFQVVPNNRLSPEMIAAGERTIESLRLKPEDCIDYEGRRFRLHGLHLDTRPSLGPRHGLDLKTSSSR